MRLARANLPLLSFELIDSPMKSRARSSRFHFAVLVVQLLGIAALVGGVVYVITFLDQASRDLSSQERAAATVLQDRVQEAALKSDLELRAHDFRRIDDLVVRRDSFADFIALLEGTAQQFGVFAQVLNISETSEALADDSFGDIHDVRVRVLAYGAPELLLRFLHAVEHLPYLLTVPVWDFSVAAVTPPLGPVAEQLRARDIDPATASQLVFEVVVALSDAPVVDEHAL